MTAKDAAALVGSLALCAAAGFVAAVLWPFTRQPDNPHPFERQLYDGTRKG